MTTTQKVGSASPLQPLHAESENSPLETECFNSFGNSTTHLKLASGTALDTSDALNNGLYSNIQIRESPLGSFVISSTKDVADPLAESLPHILTEMASITVSPAVTGSNRKVQVGVISYIKVEEDHAQPHRPQMISDLLEIAKRQLRQLCVDVMVVERFPKEFQRLVNLHFKDPTLPEEVLPSMFASVATGEPADATPLKPVLAGEQLHHKLRFTTEFANWDQLKIGLSLR